MNVLDSITPGTTESWLVLFLLVSVCVWPLMIWAGTVWGRMQLEDELRRAARRMSSKS